ncbi:MAG: flippase-like domain-containing protein [Mucilaginibacter polytrichastri]|nr:flippase-like domain-containing protein [Mucilaginibacter polytrichastri]
MPETGFGASHGWVIFVPSMTEDTIDEELPKQTPKQVAWGIAKTLLKIGFTGALLYFVFRKIPVADVKKVFLSCDPLYLFLAFLTFVVSQIISSWRLLGIFRTIGLDLSFTYNFRLYLLGMFYNLFLPGGIGGDGYKIYLLKKHFSHSGKKIFWSIMMDRLSGVWALALIAITLLIFIPQIGFHYSIPLAAFFAGTAIYYFVVRRFFKDFGPAFVPAHLKAVGVQSFQVISVILILLGIDFAGKFSPYLFTFLISSLASIFPLTVGGLGAREYVFTHASGIFDMNQAIAVFISISFYLISALFSFFGLYFVLRPHRLRHAEQQTTAATDPSTTV